MTNKKIEEKIYEEFDKRKPELFDKIMEQCPEMKKEPIKESYIDRLRILFRSSNMKYSFASFVLIVLFVFVLFNNNTGTTKPYSVIALDVNPSIVLELDEDGKVVEIIENNEDAEQILEDMDLVGVDYNVAINAIIGSMVVNGYITDTKNSVLLSIDSENTDTEETLMSELSTAISSLLENSSISGSVITQNLDFEQDAEDLADELNISEAKAELILDIIALDPRMTSEELASLTINDLSLLLDSKNYPLNNIFKNGNASTSELIPQSEIIETVLEHLSINIEDVIETDIELEQEDGLIIYELEIETVSNNYEVQINAKSGDILSSEVDEENELDEDEIPLDIMSEASILQMVYQTLDMDQSLVSIEDVSLENEEGFYYFVIELTYESDTYEIEVNAQTGIIITIDIDSEEIDNDELDSDSEEDVEDEQEEETEEDPDDEEDDEEDPDD